jgi:hypothetical protein
VTTLAYFADILYTDGFREEVWLTIDERNDLTGDERVAAATYVPAVRKADGDRMNAAAWLLELVVPGPLVTTNQAMAMSAWQLGATVTPLQLSTQGD